MTDDSGNVIQGRWAAPLRNCGGGISREHYVSEWLFPNQSIFVQGLDWCHLSIQTLTLERSR
jgi:hypothetical protein